MDFQLVKVPTSKNKQPKTSNLFKEDLNMHMHLISASFIIFLLLDCCHDNTSYRINEIWNLRCTHVCARFLHVIVSTLLWAFCLWAFVNIMQMWVIIELVEIFVYSESLVMSHKPSRARNTCFPAYQITLISNSTHIADWAALSVSCY